VLDEHDIIGRLLKPLAGEGAFAFTDDSACVTPPVGMDLVITADAIVEGVHFFKDDPPASIARKLLGVNLSDLAAKGATPWGATLTLGLPPTTEVAWVEAFVGGLDAGLKAANLALWGGDTVRAPALHLTLTAVGLVPHGKMIRRSTARIGDILAVTGAIGDAALGLLVRQEDPRVLGLSRASQDFLLDRYLHPQPRNDLAPLLQEYATAAMDISDGFYGDTKKLLTLSGVSAEIQVADIPLSAAAQEAVALDAKLWELILTGGDDYEVLFTVRPQDQKIFSQETVLSVLHPHTTKALIIKDPQNQTVVFSCEGYTAFS
jgi:thiamine-monophosphate kinase